MTSFVKPFVLPLVLVAVLAAILGFFVMRSIQGDPAEHAAKVSVVGIPATSTPLPTGSPTASPDSASSGGKGSGSKRDPRCPIGCKCQFPTGGTVIVCHGGHAVDIP
jgi:hypothetical protein